MTGRPQRCSMTPSNPPPRSGEALFQAWDRWVSAPGISRPWSVDPGFRNTAAKPQGITGRRRAAPRLDNRNGEVQSGAGFSRRMFLEFDFMNRQQRRAAAKQGGCIGRHSAASAQNATADLFNAALRYHRNGRLAEAELLYGQVLAIELGHVHSLHNLGNLLRETGRASAAVICYERALTLEPNLVGTRSNFAATLQDLG